MEKVGSFAFLQVSPAAGGKKTGKKNTATFSSLKVLAVATSSMVFPAQYAEF
jgi:hypothetical protein